MGVSCILAAGSLWLATTGGDLVRVDQIVAVEDFAMGTSVYVDSGQSITTNIRAAQIVEALLSCPSDDE